MPVTRKRVGSLKLEAPSWMAWAKKQDPVFKITEAKKKEGALFKQYNTAQKA
jgi:hypothetical protein